MNSIALAARPNSPLPPSFSVGSVLASPEKYASKAEQDERLEFLLAWVRDYETRDDEFSLREHRRLFDGFPGVKREYTSPS